MCALLKMHDCDTLPLSLLILSFLPLTVLSKDCDGLYRGPNAVANVINNNQDGFVVFSNGVKFKTAGPLRNGAPPTSWSEAQLGQVSLLWVYANGSQLVSRQGNNLARQEVDDKNWIVGEDITKSPIYQSVTCITAYEDKLLVQFSDKQILVRQNRIEFTAELPNDQSLHPTELTRTKDNDVIAFFGPLVGLYEHSKQPILPIYLQKTRKYWLSRAWLGCEPDLCFDSSIDAVSNDGQYLELYKAKHIVKVNMATKAVSITTPAKGYFVDAAIRDKDDLYLFINNKAYKLEKSGSISQVRYFSKNGNTQAGFMINKTYWNTFYLIYKGDVTILDHSLRSDPIKDLWPDLPEKTVDGATAFKGFIYFFFGDYYYRTSSLVNKTNPVNGPFLTQFDLLDCKNDYYKNSVAAQALGIVDKVAFKFYISQFKPKPSTATSSPETTPSTDDSTGSTRSPERSTANEPSNSTQPVKTKSTRGLFFLIAMVLLGLIALIAMVTLLLQFKWTNRVKSMDTLDRTTVVTIDSLTKEVDDEHWIVGEEIIKSPIYQGAICITAYEDKLLVQYNDKQVLVRQNQVEFTAQLPSNKSFHPTHLTRTKDDDIIAFFGPLVGLYEHSEQPILPIDLKKTKKYYLSRAWLGCEPDLCFDGSIDAASSDGQDLELYKAKHIVKVNMSTKAVSITTPANGYFVDAAIRRKETLYLFIGNKAFTLEKDGSISETKLFNLTGSTEDAAFSIGSKFYLIHQREVTIYGSSLPEFARTEALWPELPERTIDGATVFGEHVYFFVGDFYYRTRSAVQEATRVYGPYSIQFDLLDCSDDYYKNSRAAKQLNIRDKNTFKIYIDQFKPKWKPSTAKPRTTPRTESTGSTWSNYSSSKQTIKTNSSRAFVFLIAMVVLFSIVFIALVVLLVHLKLTKKNNSVDAVDQKVTVVTADSVD
ncbi:hypothetical protein HDE_13105 [Halotydeus destructor]|nr:hypothetical protein HDE_13105 [Halotydeus destructor]